MDRPRFIFRGNAVGVAGHILKPEDKILWVQGASSLPVIGGYSRSAVERVVFDEFLSAESVKTQSNGVLSEEDKAFRTIATSAVRTLNIARRLTADLVETTLISRHPLDGSQPTIIPTGTTIQNMRLDGYPVNVKLDVDLFTRYGTMDSLSKAYASDEAFYKRYGSRFWSSGGTPPKTTTGKRQIPVVSGYVMCSIVEKIDTSHPKAKINGNVITLPGFGNIHLGELLITGVSRRLTLLRVQLGSPPVAAPSGATRARAQARELGSWVTGDIACSEVEDNGIIVI